MHTYSTVQMFEETIGIFFKLATKVVVLYLKKEKNHYTQLKKMRHNFFIRNIITKIKKAFYD